MDAETVRSALQLGEKERTTAWLAQLDELGPPPEPVLLPRGDDARELLRLLEVPELDAEEIVAATPDPDRDPGMWWLLERAHHAVVRHMGDFTVKQHGPPSVPYEAGAAARYFHVYVFLATISATRRYHAELGIPDPVAWETLAQLGEMVAQHRRTYGEGGMNMQFWLTLHLRGVLYRLGRLQFNLVRRDGMPLIGIHVPGVGGSLSPQACDDSLRRARPFFDRYFPEHGARMGFGTPSWIRDPQLAEYLPEESNVVRYMRRWTLTDAESVENGDDSILEFVFRYNGQPLDKLPQRTTLERAVVAHLKVGRHWHARTGRLQLP